MGLTDKCTEKITQIDGMIKTGEINKYQLNSVIVLLEVIRQKLEMEK